jgi:hypothetical protein
MLSYAQIFRYSVKKMKNKRGNISFLVKRKKWSFKNQYGNLSYVISSRFKVLYYTVNE